jgi:DNA primase
MAAAKTPTTPPVELEVGGRTVRVTSPDRVVFPALGLTKLDVVQHFVAMGDGILGALLHRPTTLERWPKGVFEGAVMATRADSTGAPGGG